MTTTENVQVMYPTTTDNVQGDNQFYGGVVCGKAGIVEMRRNVRSKNLKAGRLPGAVCIVSSIMHDKKFCSFEALECATRVKEETLNFGNANDKERAASNASESNE